MIRMLCRSGVSADVLPLLAAGLLPGSADGHGVGRGVQGGAARAALPRALHAAAAAHHGLRQSNYTFYYTLRVAFTCLAIVGYLK